jgi:hypothetical protein
MITALATVRVDPAASIITTFEHGGVRDR